MIAAHLEAINLGLKEDLSQEDKQVYMEYTNGWTAHYVGVDGTFKVLLRSPHPPLLSIM